MLVQRPHELEHANAKDIDIIERAHAGRVQHQAAPCNRLPDELLQDIFATLLPYPDLPPASPSFDAADAYDDFRRAVDMSCSRWSRLIRQTPECWSLVICDPTKPAFSLDYVNLVLRRSDKIRLHLFVNFVGNTRIIPEDVLILMTALQPHMLRCYSLVLAASEVSQVTGFRPLSSVKHFHLTLRRDYLQPTDLPELDNDLSLPPISPVSFYIQDAACEDGYMILGTMSLGHFDSDNLTYLHLSVVECGLLDVLRLSRRLQYADICISPREPFLIPPNLELPKLVSLHLRGYVNLAHLTSSLAAMPHLRRLHLHPFLRLEWNAIQVAMRRIFLQSPRLTVALHAYWYREISVEDRRRTMVEFLGRMTVLKTRTRGMNGRTQ